MTHRYIKVPAIYRKLKQTELEHCVLYLHAPAGYGKTAAVEYYLRNKPYLSLNGQEGCLDNMPPLETIEESIIVADDISWITDSKSISYLVNLVKNEEKQVFLIGRSQLPLWLKSSCMDTRILQADEQDLRLEGDQIKKLLAAHKITVTPEELADIRRDTNGYATVVKLLAYRMSDGKHYGVDVKAETQDDLFHYYDTAFYEKWDYEMKRQILQLAAFDTFTLRMAEMVTGCTNARLFLEKTAAVGDFITGNGQGEYALHPSLKKYLLWKQEKEFTQEQRNNIYYNAGLYYELADDIEQALHHYAKGNSQSKIAELLIKNAMKHPGNGHYFQTRNYYLALPTKQIESSPILMCGMSMLHSLLLQSEESEGWYDALVAFAKRTDISRSEKKEAQSRIAYLDIALPHRGSLKLSEILRNAAVLCLNRSVSLPEFSVTSNMPSVMNGGKDFCAWSKNDRELARTLKKPVELVLGTFGIGLVNVALSESTFEKGTMDTYEVISLLNSAYALADAKGKPEMCFAAVGIMARVHLSRGQPHMVLSQLADFREKAVREQVTQLLPNIDALLVWVALLLGDTPKAERWLQQEAPNENLEFYILERYRYLTKVRAYIAFGQLEAAVNLIERLSLYFTEYSRTYQSIECGLLRAIVQYRMRLGDWQASLKTALHKAQEYGFIRVVQQEGIALKPLLAQAKDLDLAPAYLNKILQAVDEMALFYPDYLQQANPLQEPLTATEEQILKLLCQDVPIPKIAELCGVSYNTVKYHNKNVYRKLRINNRSDAQSAAKRLGLYGGGI